MIVQRAPGVARINWDSSSTVDVTLAAPIPTGGRQLGDLVSTNGVAITAITVSLPVPTSLFPDMDAIADFLGRVHIGVLGDIDGTKVASPHGEGNQEDFRCIGHIGPIQTLLNGQRVPVSLTAEGRYNVSFSLLSEDIYAFRVVIQNNSAFEISPTIRYIRAR